MDEKKKRIIHISVVILVIVFIISILLGLMLKYEIEGEKNMPFELTKISIISTAVGEQKEQSTNKWDLNIIQKNDIYFQIEKNENFNKEDKIKNIIIGNMQMAQYPQKGTIKLYKPSGIIATDNSIQYKYNYNEVYEAKNDVTYVGATNTNVESLEIGNQGGLIGVSIAIDELGEYISNEDETIIHDGTLLQKLQINEEYLKAQIKFDFIIETQADRQYKATISLDLPTGDIIQTGSDIKEDAELNNVIFKRIK